MRILTTLVYIGKDGSKIRDWVQIYTGPISLAQSGLVIYFAIVCLCLTEKIRVLFL